jgi:hypothetical protein
LIVGFQNEAVNCNKEEEVNAEINKDGCVYPEHVHPLNIGFWKFADESAKIDYGIENEYDT